MQKYARYNNGKVEFFDPVALMKMPVAIKAGNRNTITDQSSGLSFSFIDVKSLDNKHFGLLEEDYKKYHSND